jgi:tetratricopeptide (TPR) repeat protein
MRYDHFAPVIGVGLALSTLAMSGCVQATTRYAEIELAPGQVDAFMVNKPKALRPLCKGLLRQGFRNEVLNAMRIGLCAMELDDEQTAMGMFVTATTGIERILADEAEVMRITRDKYGEGAKPFKGEGYERAMAYYYRGLLHFREGDFFRARACFRAGLSQDAFAESDENRTDFALLAYLMGWASWWGGDPALARQDFDIAQRMRPRIVIPRPDRAEQVLVVVETGYAPRKVSDGLGHAMLKFRRGRGFEEESARLNVNGKTVTLIPIESIYRQSCTRGVREIDHILAGKGARYKSASDFASTTADAGEAVALVGSAFGGPVSAVGGGLGVASMVSTAAQMNANPEADTRYWDNLPDKVHVGIIQAQVGDVVEVQFCNEHGTVLPTLTQQAVVASAGPYGILWARSRKSNIAQMTQRDYWDNLGN